MSDNERLIKLEERYAHLQRHVTQQDKAMLELSDEVAGLRKEIAALRAQLASASDSENEPEERPPHY